MLFKKQLLLLLFLSSVGLSFAAKKVYRPSFLTDELIGMKGYEQSCMVGFQDGDGGDNCYVLYMKSLSGMRSELFVQLVQMDHGTIQADCVPDGIHYVYTQRRDEGLNLGFINLSPMWGKNDPTLLKWSWLPSYLSYVTIVPQWDYKGTGDLENNPNYQLGRAIPDGLGHYAFYGNFSQKQWSMMAIRNNELTILLKDSQECKTYDSQFVDKVSITSNNGKYYAPVTIFLEDWLYTDTFSVVPFGQWLCSGTQDSLEYTYDYVHFPQVKADDDHVFLGWLNLSDSVIYNVTDVLRASIDHKFIAQYANKVYCILNYPAQTDSIPLAVGATYELPLLTSSDACDSEMNVFLGWTSRSLSSPASYCPLYTLGGTPIVVKQDTTYYALWTNSSRTRYITQCMPPPCEIIRWNTNSIYMRYNGSASKLIIKSASMTDTFELASLQLDYTIYDIPFTSVSYDTLHFSFLDKTNAVISTQNHVVPILIHGDMLASTLDAQKSELLDVVILPSSRLKIDNGTFRCKSITVYGDGKLTIPSGYHVYVESLALQAGHIGSDGYQHCYPQMVANGTIHYSQSFDYLYVLSAGQYYTLTVPMPVAVNTISYMDSLKASLGIQYYDGVTRAEQGRNGWKALPSTDILMPGKGYTIYATPRMVQTADGKDQRLSYSLLRFPLASSGQFTETETDPIPVEKPTAVRPNDVGWNLVGNPYFANYNSLTSLTSNGIGLLKRNAQEEYEWVDQLRYVVIPSNDGKRYSQQLATSALLPSFKNFFVQIGQGDALSFSLDHRVSAAPSRIQETENDTLVVLQVYNTEVVDEVGILIGNQYTDTYEINADLQKWWNKDVNFFAQIGSDTLAYAAIAVPYTRDIQLGLASSQQQTMTIRMVDSLSTFESSIYLLDTYAQIITDLTKTSYTFQSEPSQINRFVLRLGKSISTSLSSVKTQPNASALQYFDVLGRQLPVSETNRGCGIYIDPVTGKKYKMIQ